MLNDVEEIEQWYLLPKIMIYMIGLISTNEPFTEFTPEEIWSIIKKGFSEQKEKHG